MLGLAENPSSFQQRQQMHPWDSPFLFIQWNLNTSRPAHAEQALLRSNKSHLIWSHFVMNLLYSNFSCPHITALGGKMKKERDRNNNYIVRHTMDKVHYISHYLLQSLKWSWNRLQVDRFQIGNLQNKNAHWTIPNTLWGGVRSHDV